MRSGFGLAERPAKTKVNYLYLQKNNHFQTFCERTVRKKNELQWITIDYKKLMNFENNRLKYPKNPFS